MTSDPLESQIFHAARKMALREEQDAYLDEACGNDAALRERIVRLLVAFSRESKFLERPAMQLDETNAQCAKDAQRLLADSTDENELDLDVAGVQVGRFELLEKIGEGGFGVVYKAQQKEPVLREVALKIIKRGMDSRQVIARFEAERQALALMDHPNIARVLDGGETSDGNPFFVMELVDGIRINEYCDENRLTPDERLRLFVSVCEAVQHAHQKGIIHRDLKPSNVLVQEQDGKPVVKVIDFGLAKAMEQNTRLSDKTIFTEIGQVMGTLQYMSPEQAEMDVVNVDTRSDIYSLGAMLYELLTGSTPIEKKAIEQHAILKILEFVREKEPPRPSLRLNSSAEKISSISDLRKIQPLRLQQILHGELDWIVMKSLEKEPERRYQTANGMAEDIIRYLNCDVVLARPPSTSYRVGKFIRRNRGFVASLAIIATLLLSAVGVSSIFAIQANLAKEDALAQKRTADNEKAKAEKQKGLAEQARIKAEAARNRADLLREQAQHEAKTTSTMLGIMTNSFESVDPMSGATHEMTAKDVLLTILNELEDAKLDGKAKSSMLWSLSNSFRGIGENQQAVVAAEQCFKLREDYFGSEHPETLRARDLLASAYDYRGNLDKAHQLREKNLLLMKKILGPNHADTLNVMVNLASSREDAGRLKDALDLRTETLKQMQEKFGPKHFRTLQAMTNLCNTYSNLGLYDEELELREKTLALKLEVLGEEHPDTLTQMDGLANLYTDMGRRQDANELRQKNLNLLRKVLGPKHPGVLTAMNNLSEDYVQAGKLEEGIELRERTLELMQEVHGPKHPTTLELSGILSSNYSESGRHEDAIELLERSFEFLREIHGPDHHDTMVAESRLGICYFKSGRLKKGVEFLQNSASQMKKKLGEKHPSTLIAMSSLASQLSNHKIQLPKALKLFYEIHANSLELWGEKHPATRRASNNLGYTLGRSEERFHDLISKGAVEVGFYDEAEEIFETMVKFSGPQKLPQRFLKMFILLKLNKKEWQLILDRIDEFKSESRDAIPPKASYVAMLDVSSAVCHSELGQYDDAIEAVWSVQENNSCSSTDRARAKSVLAICLANQDELDRAKQFVNEAVEHLESEFADFQNHLLIYHPRAIERVIKVYELADEPEQVSKWKQKLAETRTEINKRVAN